MNRASAYVSDDLYGALRERASGNNRTVSSELKTILRDAVAGEVTAMTDNETHLSMAMSHLRKITSRTTDETKRVQEYVDAIETELDRIRADRELG